MRHTAGRFRKRPVIVEAMPYDGTYGSGQAILDWADATVRRLDLVNLSVRTLEGELQISPGDWVVRGVGGEYYPVAAHYFAATYEPADDGTD
jgi:hypothetical protein